MTERKAKVTEEHRQEAALLNQLWETRSHPSQAVFGEQYEVGSQSAVGQFLRGDTPLSLKAAAGFASGLNCKISEFSPRLAAQALAYAELSGLSENKPDITELSKPETQLVLMFREMTQSRRNEILKFALALHQSPNEEKRAPTQTPPTAKGSSKQSTSNKKPAHAE